MNTEIVKKWLERVEYDLQTAEAMHETRRYIYVLFMCQQAIEKCLKALLANNDSEILPYHNLRRLAEQAGVIEEIEQDSLKKFDFLSQYYINARYKEDIQQLSKGVTTDVSREFIEFAKETIKWLNTKISF